MKWWVARMVLTNPATWCAAMLLAAMCVLIVDDEPTLAMIAAAGAVGWVLVVITDYKLEVERRYNVFLAARLVPLDDVLSVVGLHSAAAERALLSRFGGES